MRDPRFALYRRIVTAYRMGCDRMTSSPTAHAPDRLTRVVVAFVGWVTRHPRAVLLGCLAFVAASVHLAYAELEYHTQRNDLLSADKVCQQRWTKYLKAFGDDDDMWWLPRAPTSNR